MKLTWKTLIPVCLLFAFAAACKEAQLDDLTQEAQGVIEDARERAKELGQLSEDEIQKIWAVEYKTIRVPQTDLAVLDEKLSELGKDRWDCYHVSEEENGRVVYLKRRESNAFRYVTELLRIGALAL